MPSVRIEPLIQVTAGSFAKYPAELGIAPWEKWILFEAKSGRHIARNGFVQESSTVVDRTLASVAMYLPTDALKSSMTVAYKTADYGAAAGLAIETATQIQGSLRAPTSGFGGGSNIASLLKGLGGAAVGAVQQTATKAVTDVAQQVADIPPEAFEAAKGGAVNPRTDTMFGNVEYRTHDFTFKLIPRSKEEADAIDTILNVLHFYSLPDYGTGTGNFFIGYPYEFVITMFKETHINKIERSVLTSLSVDHAGGDRVAFAGDYFPAATALTLSFKEVRLLGRDSEVIFRGGAGKSTFTDPRAGTLDKQTE
jgi:hypothetical protein